jgi:hypothetical protein
VAALYSGYDGIPLIPKQGKEGRAVGKLEGKVAVAVVTGAARGLGHVCGCRGHAPLGSSAHRNPRPQNKNSQEITLRKR